MQGNWVIGSVTTPGKFQRTESTDLLINELRNRYLSNYIDIWESQLANIQLTCPNNLMELHTQLTILTGNHSPLLQMLKTIQQNTAFAVITATSPKLEMLNALLANAHRTQNNVLYYAFLSLQDLHTIVTHIVNAADQKSAALQIIKRYAEHPSANPIPHLQQLAEHTTEPMKTWFTLLSAQSELLITQAARSTNQSVQ